MSDGIRVDGMSLLILKDREADETVDYVVVANLRAPDPRFKSRPMVAGERRGLFQINKSTRECKVLFPIIEDPEGKCVFSAHRKLLQLFQAQGAWPDKAQYAAG